VEGEQDRAIGRFHLDDLTDDRRLDPSIPDAQVVAVDGNVGPSPSPLLVAVHAHATPSVLGVGRRRKTLPFAVEQLDAHDGAVVLEDLAELSELDLVVEAGQMLAHTAHTLRGTHHRPSGHRQEDQAAQGQGGPRDSRRREQERHVDQAVERLGSVGE